MRRLSAGFTLLELMVVVAIIGILSAIIIANLQGANGRGRDAERQSELRQLQIAIEAYKRVNGRYPEMGCGRTINSAATPATGDGFSTEAHCADYIVGLAPQFIDRLPKDPRRDGDEQGYAYTTNADGTVYKVMAMRTVESESVTYNHPMKSCDIIPPAGGGNPGWNGTGVNPGVGWCLTVNYPDPRTGTNAVRSVPDCRQAGHSPNTSRFSSSYGLWGGIVMYPATETAITVVSVRDTAQVICE